MSPTEHRAIDLFTPVWNLVRSDAERPSRDLVPQDVLLIGLFLKEFGT